MEAEKIIISKKYFELTPFELELVAPLVSNEAEFDDMKTFLLSTQNTFESQRIACTPELDNKILAELNASASTNRTFFNTVLLFLFPRDKRIMQYPAFQLVVATVLIFGIFNAINFDNLKNDNSMAFKDDKEESETLDVLEEFLLKEESDNQIFLEKDTVYKVNSIRNNVNFEDLESNEILKDKAPQVSPNNNLIPMDYNFEESAIASIQEGDLQDDFGNVNEASNGELIGNENSKVEEDKMENEEVAMSSFKEEVKQNNDESLKKKIKNSPKSSRVNSYNADDNEVGVENNDTLVKDITFQNTPELKQLFFESK